MLHSFRLMIIDILEVKFEVIVVDTGMMLHPSQFCFEIANFYVPDLLLWLKHNIVGIKFVDDDESDMLLQCSS